MILKNWLIALTLIGLSASLLKANPFWEVSAHRGDRGSYRENSLSALMHAMEIGAGSVEFDVHLTKDGVPIIYHDYKLRPSDFVGLNASVLIKNLTLQEIKALSFSDSLTTLAHDTGLITLEEFLLAIRARELNKQKTIPLHLEIKSEKKPIADSAPVDLLALNISQIINKVKIKTPIFARSFNWDVLTVFRKHQPNISQVLLVNKGDWLKIDFIQAIAEFKPIAFAPHYSDLTSESIAFLTKRNIDVNPWTVNAPEVADELLRMGVTGITTDNPSAFLKRYAVIIKKNICLRFY